MQVPHLHHLLEAAEGGDVRAMVLLAEHFHENDLAEQAEPWARAAAETGDPEGMDTLSHICTTMALGGRYPAMAKFVVRYGNPDHERAFKRWSDESRRWKVKAAEAGHEGAISSLARMSNSAEERERWLRHGAAAGHGWLRSQLLRLLREQQRFEEAEPWQRAAAEAGEPDEQLMLAQRLIEQGHLDEAEHWFRVAASSTSKWISLDAARELVRLLTDQGRDDEAEHWLGTIANSDGRQRPLEAAWELARRLAEQGREDEAAQWHRRAREIANRPTPPPPEVLMPSPSVPEIALTALVSTAVLPFVQTLVSKAAEETYAQARELIRRLPLRRDVSRSPGNTAGLSRQMEARFVIVDDPEAGISLYLSSDVSDEALRALAAFDLNELTARRPDAGRVRLVWHQASGAWRIRGETDQRPTPPSA